MCVWGGGTSLRTEEGETSEKEKERRKECKEGKKEREDRGGWTRRRCTA